MMENPPRLSRKDGTHLASKGGPTRKNRHIVDESGDLIECSGKHCQSCAAGLIADCVALCCCPCALVNILALVFVKLPWMIGRRCLGRDKRKKKRLERERKCRKSREAKGEGDIVEVARDRDCRRERTEEEISEIATGFGELGETARFSARFEAESVWVELYQVGHLGFGRVSFTGIQS